MKNYSCTASPFLLSAAVCWCVFIATTGCQENPPEAEAIRAPDQRSEYVGRYAVNADLVLEVKKDGEWLTLLPSFWGSAQVLDSREKDSFVSLLHPRMQFRFDRDSEGNIVSLTSAGNRELNGTAQKLAPGETLPVELLLAGDPEGAAAKLKADPATVSEERVVNLGFKFIKNYRSRGSEGVAFLSAFESEYSGSVDLHQVIGLGNLLANDRKQAKSAFRKALLIDPTDRLSSSVLRILDPTNATRPPKEAWTVPFDLNELFMAPSPGEIAEVRRDWESRDLTAKAVEQVDERIIRLGERSYNLRVLRHEVQGFKHYGAVLIPEGATLGSSPVVLELHGVDSKYSPFKVVKVKATKILRENQPQAIIAIPSFRGNTLVVEEQSYTSEGPASEAWDEAADDAIAFLNVVIRTVPEADANRIAALGKSRGGTIAMLVGIRDPRIGSLVNWAGPAEWFSNMGTFGFTLQEQVQWGLWERWTPGQGWGSSSQFIDWFLMESIENGEPKLKAIRHRVLASSPLYFVDRLPTAQLHYGVEDGGVPIANGKALKRALELRDEPAPLFEIYLHENTGHDQPYPKAYELSRQFLIQQFLN